MINSKRESDVIKKLDIKKEIIRQSACVVVNPITVYVFGLSLIFRRWIRPQTQ